MKEKLLQNLRNAIEKVQEKIESSIEMLKTLDNKSIEEIKSMKVEDQALFLNLKGNTQDRLEELAVLHKSPYFMKCEVTYEKSGKTKTFYFAKHQFIEESIYSWVAPAASIRFEKPGAVTYKLPTGKIEHAILKSKEQYMIVDGKVIFFATEAISTPRELIYQEHFSTRKSGFILPEIVEVMEKAQDQVVRAHHVGPFVISGPAGSGKTTLALHRVAYLVQAPDTSEHYPSKTIIVFVQDNGTQEYFSHLLPELGIKNVRITTFSEWAIECLAIEDATCAVRIGSNEQEKDTYEYEKIQALRTGKFLKFTRNYLSNLQKIYAPHFSTRSLELFKEQKENNTYDRIDLTILLKAYLESHERIIISHEYYAPSESGDLLKKTRRTPVEYSLIVVDEFQNYMPEQLQIFNRALEEERKSIIYVGDIAQQIKLGTIREWSHIGNIKDERKVVLEKVYRNTKQILEYIGSLGYKLSIPEGIKQGDEVCEKIFESKYEEISYINSVIEKNKDGSVGVLSKDDKYIEEYKKIFKNLKNIHVLSIAEAQGVEFDTVIIVGVHKNMFSFNSILPQSFRDEKSRIDRDLLYVGLTRAISQLHVIGECGLKLILNPKP
ncbi:MAG: hypothetical protein EXS50_00940 [Candidatus Taylorbacteria bacterium]|nr:hypothetical protein [Candidatus Taylorbacteria bacterium]